MSVIKWVLTQIESIHYLDGGHQENNQLGAVVPVRVFVGLASNSKINGDHTRFSEDAF